MVGRGNCMKRLIIRAVCVILLPVQPLITEKLLSLFVVLDICPRHRFINVFHHLVKESGRIAACGFMQVPAVDFLRVQFPATNGFSSTVVGMEMLSTGAFLCSSSRQSEVDFQVRMTDYFSVLGPPCILKGPPNLESSSINGAKKYVPTKRTHTLLNL